MTTLRTDPARVRLVLAHHARHGITATMQEFDLSSKTIYRWLRLRDAHGPDWPTLAMDREWLERRDERRRLALKSNRYRMARAANGGRPLKVDATGTHRRIRALMRLGWPSREIARSAGWDCRVSVTNVLRYGKVSAASAARIRRTYDELSMKVGPSPWTRAYAERAGWPPPLAWDDDTIDDPKARPARRKNRDLDVDEVVVERILAGDWRMPARKAERLAVIARWEGPLNELDRLTGWNTRRDLQEAS